MYSFRGFHGQSFLVLRVNARSIPCTPGPYLKPVRNGSPNRSAHLDAPPKAPQHRGASRISISRHTPRKKEKSGPTKNTRMATSAR